MGRGLEDLNKNFKFFTDGLDTGHFILLPHEQSTIAICYRMRIVR